MSGRDQSGSLVVALGLGIACLVALFLPAPRAGAVPADADSSLGPEVTELVTLGPMEVMWGAAWAGYRAAWVEYGAAVAPLLAAPLGEDSLRALTRRLLSVRPVDLLRAPADTSRAARLVFLRAFYGEDLLRQLPRLEAAIQGRRAAAVVEREIDLFGEHTLRR